MNPNPRSALYHFTVPVTSLVAENSLDREDADRRDERGVDGTNANVDANDESVMAAGKRRILR